MRPPYYPSGPPAASRQGCLAAHLLLAELLQLLHHRAIGDALSRAVAAVVDRELELVFLEERVEQLAPQGADRVQRVEPLVVLQQDRGERLRRRPADDLRPRCGVVLAVLGAAVDGIGPRRGARRRFLAIADEADLRGGIAHAVRADRGVADDRAVAPHASAPLVGRAVLGLELHVAHRRLAEIQQEARRALERVVEDIVAAGHQARGLERAAALVGELHARVEAGLQVVCCERVACAERAGRGANPEKIASLHGGPFSVQRGPGVNYCCRDVIRRTSAAIPTRRRTAIPSRAARARSRRWGPRRRPT